MSLGHYENQFAYVALEAAFDFRKNGEVLPTWFITSDKGEHIVIGTPFSPDGNKAQQSKAVADFVRIHNAIEVMFVSDVWTRSVPIDAPESETLKRPSLEPDSVEAIIVQIFKKDRTQHMIMRQYRQKDNGELEILEQKESDEISQMWSFQEILDALYE